MTGNLDPGAEDRSKTQTGNLDAGAYDRSKTQTGNVDAGAEDKTKDADANLEPMQKLQSHESRENPVAGTKTRPPNPLGLPVNDDGYITLYHEGADPNAPHLVVKDIPGKGTVAEPH